MPKKAQTRAKTARNSTTSRMGRPPKYGRKCLKAANDYYTRHVKDADLMPTIEELAIELEVDRWTINDWTKKHADFSHTIKRLKTLQKLRLTHRGLDKDKPFFETFLLKANHQMMEEEKKRNADKESEVELRITVVDETENRKVKS